MSTPLTWKETRFLKVPLTDDEIQARGEQLAKLVDEEADMFAGHKTVRDAMREEADRMHGQIRRLAAIVRERVEERSVEIELRVNLTLGLVEEVRTDSGEIVKSRGVTEEDKLRAQLRLPGEPSPAEEGGRG
jgi:glutamate-1-semialdehyde aminotransferase